jgi:hypothetical protein
VSIELQVIVIIWHIFIANTTIVGSRNLKLHLLTDLSVGSNYALKKHINFQIWNGIFHHVASHNRMLETVRMFDSL